METLKEIVGKEIGIQFSRSGAVYYLTKGKLARICRSTPRCCEQGFHIGDLIVTVPRPRGRRVYHVKCFQRMYFDDGKKEPTITTGQTLTEKGRPFELKLVSREEIRESLSVNHNFQLASQIENKPEATN